MNADNTLIVQLLNRLADLERRLAQLEAKPPGSTWTTQQPYHYPNWTWTAGTNTLTTSSA